MKQINNLQNVKEKEKVVIDIPKNMMAMVVTYIFIDNEGDIRLINSNIDTQKLKEETK